MTCINTRVEVNNGRAVAVPLGKGKIGFSQHLAVGLNDGSGPRVGGTHHVGGLVHHDAGLGRVTTPLWREVEEIQFLVEFEVFHSVPCRKRANRLCGSFHQPSVDQGCVAKQLESEVLHDRLVGSRDFGVQLVNDGKDIRVLCFIERLKEVLVHFVSIAQRVRGLRERGRCGPHHQQLEQERGENQRTTMGCHGIFRSSACYKSGGSADNRDKEVPGPLHAGNPSCK